MDGRHGHPRDRRPTPEATFEIIDRFKPTLYFGVPTLYAALLVALDAEPREPRLRRACVSAGEALPADIFRRWQERTGAEILDGIGSTECLHIFICNRPGDIGPAPAASRCPATRRGSSTTHGQPVRRRATAAGSGSRASSTAKYYWNKPEKTAETMLDGWLNTGDTYREDADGYF